MLKYNSKHEVPIKGIVKKKRLEIRFLFPEVCLHIFFVIKTFYPFLTRFKRMTPFPKWRKKLSIQFSHMKTAPAKKKLSD